jgi:hypothetical protein
VPVDISGMVAVVASIEEKLRQRGVCDNQTIHSFTDSGTQYRKTPY